MGPITLRLVEKYGGTELWTVSEAGGKQLILRISFPSELDFFGQVEITHVPAEGIRIAEINEMISTLLETRWIKILDKSSILPGFFVTVPDSC